MEQIQLVLDGLGVESNDLAGQSVNWPRLKRDGAKPAAARDQSLRVEGAKLTMEFHGLRNDRDAAGDGQRAIWGGR